MGITVGKYPDSIYLVQEVYYSPKGRPGVRVKSHFHGKPKARAGIYLSSLTSCTFVPLDQFTDHDIATGTIEGGSVTEPTVIASIYLHGESATILPKFRELVEYCQDKNLPLICGIDCNAHSPLWGSRDTNKRGEELEEFIFQHNLFIENIGSTPTWRNVVKGISSIIDITLSYRVRNRISNWHVHPDQSLSDHRLLYFKVDNPGDGKVLTRNYAKANWPIFTTIVESELGPPPSLWSNSIIESASLMLTQVINSALDKACPKHFEKKRDKLFWWNQECQLAKVHYKKLERKMLRSQGGPSVLQREEAKKARNELKHTIRRAKMHSFRTFVRETENVPAMSRLNKILDQKQSHPLGFTKKPNGEITTSTQETLNVMMAEHFPGSIAVQEPGDDREFRDPPRPIETCDWIDNFRIRTAISQFGPMKSPGQDDLKPIVLQKLPDCAISYLRCLYNACIQLSYTPIQWCHSEVIFISKVGKDCYLNPRSFRPISLMVFTFKVLEIIIVWRVEETAFKVSPLHRRQYAFRKNLSTEHALSESINLIERSIYRGEMVIGIYLDIKGAFDNVASAAIIKSLKRKGVENTVLNWFENYLENRTCESSLGGSKSTAKLTRGSPQGGCSSPVLGWNCPYDDLLEAYDDTAVEPYGFADDTKLLIPGIDFSTCFDNAQMALNIAEIWARSIGVSFCPEKTAVIFFSRGLWQPTRQLKLYGNSLPWAETTKWLGITIDRNLSFLSHIDNRIAKAKKKLMILRHVFDQTWGPNPKITRWAYTGIVRPSLTYGSIAFACKTRSQNIKDRFRTLQRLALIQIAKVRPSTPTSALEIIYNVPPLDLFMWEVAQKTALRIGINPTWVPTNTKGHQHLILETLPNLSGRALDDTIKTISWEKNYVVEIGDGKDFAHKPEWSCYTDGSRLNELSGAGSITLQRNREHCLLSYALGDRSVYQAEVSAISNSVRNLLTNDLKHQQIIFRVDSQAALKALDNPESKSDSIREAKELLNALGKDNFVILRWIMAHKGYHYNEIADHLAKAGAEPDCTRKGPKPLPSKRHIFSQIEDTTRKCWTDRWQSGEDARQSKYFWPGPDKAKTNFILSHPRDVVSRAVRFLTGHAFLRRQNAIVFHGVSPPPGDVSCRLCEDPIMAETPHHLITECEALVFWRLSIFGVDFLDEIPYWKANDLLKFVGKKDIILLESDD